jgi:group I intron endonuclease
MHSGIYAILNIENEKIYVGSANDFQDRWRLHLLELNRNNHHNRHLQRAYNMYGRGAFIFVILQYSISWLEQLEQHWIDKLDSTNIEVGYNICKAGRNREGVKASDETRKKLSDSHKGIIPSEETKRKMSESRKGNTINNGRKWSKEAVAKRTASNTGQKRSLEAKARMSAAQKGKTFSVETRLKMSEAAKRRWERSLTI